MHGDNFSQVLMRALVSTRAARKQLEESKTLCKISSIEFGLCGGKRKPDDTTEYSLKRQLVLAERGLRSFINGEQEVFDPHIKQPAKTQMKQVINGMRSWLEDELPGWDNSDDEDVDNQDSTESAEESADEENECEGKSDGEGEGKSEGEGEGECEGEDETGESDRSHISSESEDENDEDDEDDEDDDDEDESDAHED